MKGMVIISVFCLFASAVSGQDAEKYCNKGLDKAIHGKYKASIKYFDRSIGLDSKVYITWYYRGLAKLNMKLYQEALADFNQAVLLRPDYKNAYLNRGTVKKRMANYSGAIRDYSFSIILDPDYADAYYNRALVYEMLDERDSACYDYIQAVELGVDVAREKAEKCKDTTEQLSKIHFILRLTKTAEDKTYGFTLENPIRVGTGPSGGPANQIAYLSLLRDQHDNPVKYMRLGSCCEYKISDGLFGYALLDQYEITYRDEDEKTRKAILYLSFYDYEKPMVPFGFKTVKQK